MVDIVPTLLELTGIPAPVQVDGVAQRPIEGISLAYSFAENARGFDAPSRRRIQYFEMLGVQGLYADGWMLSAVPIRAPWVLDAPAIRDPASAFRFELYDMKNDWTQFTDVAAQNPRRVQEMRDLMFGEFAKYQVLPLDASAASRFVAPRPSLAAGRRVFRYGSDTITNVPVGNVPSLLNTSYTITAEIVVPEGGGHGMLVNEGGRFFGYGLYLLNGAPVFLNNTLGIERARWQGPVLSPGRHTIEFEFKYDGLGAGTLAFNNLSGIGRGGTGTLKVDGRPVATRTIANSTPLVKPLDAVFNIGTPAGTPVDDADYRIPFTFNGGIEHITITLDPPVLSAADVRRLEEADVQRDVSK